MDAMEDMWLSMKDICNHLDGMSASAWVARDEKWELVTTQ